MKCSEQERFKIPIENSNNCFFIRTRRVISRKNIGIVGLQDTTVKKMTGKPTNPIDWPHQLIWIYTNTNYLLARKTCFVSDPQQAPFYSTTLWLLRKNTHFGGVIACRLEALVINYWWDEGWDRVNCGLNAPFSGPVQP